MTDDGDSEEDVLQKVDLDFTFECFNCVDLFSTPIAQAKYAMTEINSQGK